MKTLVLIDDFGEGGGVIFQGGGVLIWALKPLPEGGEGHLTENGNLALYHDS